MVQQSAEPIDKKISEILNQGNLLTMSKDLEFLKSGRVKETQKAKIPPRLLIEKETDVKKQPDFLGTPIKESFPIAAPAPVPNNLKKPETPIIPIPTEKPKEEIKNAQAEEQKKPTPDFAIIEKEKEKIFEKIPKKPLEEIEFLTGKRTEFPPEKESEEEKAIMEEIRRRAEKVREKPREFFKKKEEKKELAQEDLKKELENIEKKLKEFSQKKAPFDAKKESLLAEREKVMQALSPLFEKEKKIENFKKLIEEKEKQAKNLDEKHSIEKKRWEVEKKRREIESEKWKLEQHIEFIQSQIKEINKRVDAIKEEEEVFLEKREQIGNELKKFDFRKEKSFLEKELETLEKKESSLIGEKNALEQEKKELRIELENLLKNEEEIERKKDQLEEKEKDSKTLSEERSFEKERWKIEEKRKEIEEKRWTLEKNKEDFSQKSKNFDIAIKDLLKRKNEVGKKLEEIEILLNHGIKKGEKIIAEKNQPARPASGPIQPKPLQTTITKKQESAEPPKITASGISRIEAIRKMTENKKEGIESKGPISKVKIMKKLAQFSSGEENERKEFMARVSGISPQEKFLEKEKQKQKEVVFRPIVKKSSVFEKISMRILTILIIAGVIFGIYLIVRYFSENKENLPPAIQGENGTTEETITTTTEETATSTPTSTPESQAELEKTLKKALFKDEQKILEYSTDQEIAVSLSWEIEQSLEKSKFFELIFKEKTTGNFLDLKGLLNVFEARTPVSFWDKINGKDIFFIYSAEANHFGFIAKIKGTGLEELMKDWEKTISQDLKQFIVFLAGKNLTFQNQFKTGKADEKNFRYLDSSQKNFGICYSIIGNYLIFTTSGESIANMLRLLTNFQNGLSQPQ